MGQKNHINICLLGAALDTGNMGVSALAVSLVSLIRNARADCDLSFFIGRRSHEPYILNNNDENIKLSVINYRLSPRAILKEHLFTLLTLTTVIHIIPKESIRRKIINLNEQLMRLDKVDVFADIRGGDSFSDIYGLKRFIIGSLPSIVCSFLKKNLVLLPQTYGPYNSFIARLISRYILKKASIILSRDKEGIQVVQDMLKSSKVRKSIIFCPDVAFCLPPKKTQNNVIVPILSYQKPVVGFNISGLLFHGGYTKKNMFGLNMEYKSFARGMVDKFLSETDAVILLIPHTFTKKDSVESDTAACNEIYNNTKIEIRNRIHRVMQVCDQSEIKYVIGQCNFFVGSRMHACIASVSQGIPTVGVAYSKKFYGVFESVGLGHMVIDARKYDKNMAISEILKSYNNRAWEKNKVLTKVTKAQNKIKNIFNILF